MSKPERGSLTTLLAKKPLGQGAPAARPIEEAESVLIGRESVHTSVRTDIHPPDSQHSAAAQFLNLPPAGSPDRPIVQPYVRTDQPSESPTRLLNRSRRRTVRVPWTFKLPFDLREELETVARFNNLNMTEIACEAIERHLRHFPHPPGPSDAPADSE